MTTDPLSNHIDADILERCAGDIEAAAAWQIRQLRAECDGLRAALHPLFVTPWERTHPGRPCRRSDHVNEEAYQQALSAMTTTGETR